MIKIKSTHILHSIFLTLFVFSMFRSIQNFIDCYRTINIKEYDLNAVISSLTLCQDYRVSLFILIPIIGIFIKNKLGWIFIASYIYFIQINCVSQNYMDNILLLCFSTIILLAILLFINTKTSILTYYKVTPKNNIVINTIALILGTTLSYLLIILKHY